MGETLTGVQLSEGWLKSVAGKLPEGPVKTALTTAVDQKTYVTGVAGVDRATGKLVILPVKIP